MSTVGCGHITTPIPKGRLSFLAFAVSSPRLLKFLWQATEIEMSCDMVHRCKVVDAGGRPLAELTKDDGEAFVVVEVALADEKPRSTGKQPASLMAGSAYFLSDLLLPTITTSLYRKGKRRRRDV